MNKMNMLRCSLLKKNGESRTVTSKGNCTCVAPYFQEYFKNNESIAQRYYTHIVSLSVINSFLWHKICVDALA